MFKRTPKSKTHLVALRREFLAGKDYLKPAMEAVKYCRQNHEPIPYWAIDTLVAYLDAYNLVRDNPLKPYDERRIKQALVDAECYKVVEELRRNGVVFEDAWYQAAEILPESVDSIRHAYWRFWRRLKPHKPSSR